MNTSSSKLTLWQYLFIASMLFGLFFGAGNLIFPVHMGQAAGAKVFSANLGFLTTAVGLPFLGVLAIGFSKSNGLFDLSTQVNRWFAYGFTILLYLTIGTFFAIPRTASVSFEIGIAPFIPKTQHTLAQLIFSIIFFSIAYYFSRKPSKIMDIIGKFLNPLFLIFLALLIIASIIKPIGPIDTTAVTEGYQVNSFITGMLEGYNTMDSLAALAFGIIIVQAIKQLGVTHHKNITQSIFKSGLLTVILMTLIYSSLAYMGAMSQHVFPISENGSIALTQIFTYYFGDLGLILLAIIILIACLKTAIGLLTACGEAFHQLFPQISYQKYVIAFTIISCIIANVGLNQILTMAIPVLLFLHPITITLIILTFLSPLFNHNKIIINITMLTAIIISFFESIHTIENLTQYWITKPYDLLATFIPLMDLGMGWLVPTLIVFLCSFIIFKLKQNIN